MLPNLYLDRSISPPSVPQEITHKRYELKSISCSGFFVTAAYMSSESHDHVPLVLASARFFRLIIKADGAGRVGRMGKNHRTFQ